ncbi:uncharacterized protein G2W53_032881 [Senna tora]|uniref:Uncharacterized protein n=1 Tax=Senna tora TaxID=362788 RepID=A0A834SZR1_9FABA|nr:uncharacterized protein G2W53_032881 [Senna tora]
MVLMRPRSQPTVSSDRRVFELACTIARSLGGGKTYEELEMP